MISLLGIFDGSPLVREDKLVTNTTHVWGRLVTRLVDETKPAGVYRVRWDGTGNSGARVSSGVYLLRMRSEGWSEQRKIVLLK